MIKWLLKKIDSLWIPKSGLARERYFLIRNIRRDEWVLGEMCHCSNGSAYSDLYEKQERRRARLRQIEKKLNDRK